MIDDVQWRALRRLWARAFTSCLHFAIASVDAQGCPVVTPIGSLVLGKPGRAWYLELYAAGLAGRLEADPRVSVLAVDAGKAFWVRSLVGGAFTRAPAVRLHGTAAVRSRAATASELGRLARRFGPLRWTPGGRRLWPIFSPGASCSVRDLAIERVEIATMGAMTGAGVPLG